MQEMGRAAQVRRTVQVRGQTGAGEEEGGASATFFGVVRHQPVVHDRVHSTRDCE